MTGVKPPDALTRAAALVNGQPDPLLKASEANAAIAPELDHVFEKAMAQSRDQRYASASEMRKALHGIEQASTVVNRGEAKTMLFPPPGTTVATPTQTVAVQQTMTATAGDTTVVRPRSSKRVLPWALSAAVLLVLACGVFGFFILKKRNSDTTQMTNVTVAPTPVESPAVSAPTVAPAENSNQQPVEQATNQPTPKRAEKAPRKNEKKEADAEEPQVEVEGQGHEQEPPNVPTPPNIQGPRPRRQPLRILPGGVIIRTFPDGSQIRTTPDGMR